MDKIILRSFCHLLWTLLQLRFLTSLLLNAFNDVSVSSWWQYRGLATYGSTEGDCDAISAGLPHRLRITFLDRVLPAQLLQLFLAAKNLCCFGEDGLHGLPSRRIVKVLSKTSSSRDFAAYPAPSGPQGKEPIDVHRLMLAESL